MPSIPPMSSRAPGHPTSPAYHAGWAWLSRQHCEPMKRRWPLLIVALGVSDVAVAHHSYTGYDRSRSQTVQGTVIKLDWSNPHIHFWIATSADPGSADQGVYAF